MEASTRKTLRPATKLARDLLLPPLLAVVALCCVLLTIAISFRQDAKTTSTLTQQQPRDQPSHDELARQIGTKDLEGAITPADVRRAQKPLSERRRLLAAHPYFSLYTIAKQRFGVSLYLVAAVHYQETGFEKAPAQYASYRRWTRYRNATKHILRPTRYPHRTARHPSIGDDFDVVMSIAAGLRADGAKGLGAAAGQAIAQRYGRDPEGRLATAMVLERARAWRLLGTLPLPGSGELATPVKGVVGGCGYFGCPRPGHLHNGVDFLAPAGTPIHAADAGVVASVESPGQSGGYGNFVCIQHRPHLASCYAHMSAFAANVHPGARVRRGQVIGLVGSTGSSTAPHLHFEVRRGPAACQSCAVDPLPLLSGVVPEADLPKMASTAPTGARSASVFTGAPVAPTAPAAPARAAAPAPAPASPATGTAADDAHAAVPDPPIDATVMPRRNVPAASQSGGARPVDAPSPAAAPAPAQSTAAAPPEDTGTGGATADFSPSPPPPPPAAAAAATDSAPAPGGR